MTINRIALIIILLTNILNASQKMTIQELVALASTYVKVPVVLDRNIDNTIYIYTQTPLNRDNINVILNDVLSANGLKLVKYDTYYRLSVVIAEKSLYRIIKINYLDDKQIKTILAYHKQEYIYLDNKLMFTSLKNQYLEILNSLKSFDIPPIQKKMRITVLETNINKLKEYGVKYNLSDISSNMWNVSLGNINANLSPTAAQSFGIELKALVTDGITKIVTNPVMTLRDRELSQFNITRTIPVVTGSTSQGNNEEDTKTTESLEYKSFGIKVDVTPVMLVDKNSTDLDLQLKLQDIISNYNNKPETSDKILVQKVIIPDSTVYILSGFKKTLKVTNDEGVPFLKDIPYLGYFFKWVSNEDIEISLQIIIEIFEENKTFKGIFKDEK
jgi:general secretion pathway protein D